MITSLAFIAFIKAASVDYCLNTDNPPNCIDVAINLTPKQHARLYDTKIKGLKISYERDDEVYSWYKAQYQKDNKYPYIVLICGKDVMPCK